METIESDEDEDTDQPLKVPEVSSVKGALGLAKQLVEFADWRGEEQLSLVVGCVYDFLCDSLSLSRSSNHLLTLSLPKNEVRLFV